jgi:hypothetical protein
MLRWRRLMRILKGVLMLMLARYIVITKKKSYRVHFAVIMRSCTNLMLDNSEIVVQNDSCVPHSLPTCRTPVQQVRVQSLFFYRSL